MDLSSVKATLSITTLFAAVSVLWSPIGEGCISVFVLYLSVGKQRLSKVGDVPEIQQTSFPKRFSSFFYWTLVGINVTNDSK